MLKLCAVTATALLTSCWFSITIADGQSTSHAVRTLNLPNELPRYTDPQRPAYYEQAGVRNYDTTPAENPVTDAGATLGRVLFYDTQLSANHSISCGSCHVQQHAFSDPRPVSVGFDGQKTDRNSMSLNDMRFVRAGFFWDERATTLEEAVLQPLFSHVEMGLDESTLVSRLSEDERYRSLFQQAFASETVTTARVALALSQFLRAMESTQSRYDTAAAEVRTVAEDFPALTTSENLGKKIFFDRCAPCHHLASGEHVAIFAMFRSLNNGIDPDGTVRDGGLGDVTFNPSEVGSFKAGSLRNIEYTAPYMHDGRLATLEDVIEHYSTGVNRHPNLGPVTRFQFSDAEKQGLVAFLKSLSDPAFLTDSRFSDPWETNASSENARPAQPLTTDNVHADNEHVLTDLNTTKTAPSRALTWQTLLEQGQGLPASETLPWLISLDTNGDGLLRADELEPVLLILENTGATVQRSRTRAAAARVGRDAPGGPTGARARPGRTGNDADTPPPVPPQAQGDFNNDGTVSRDEAATYQAFSRFIEFGGGGRLEVFLDRLLPRFQLNEAETRIARDHLKTAKINMAKDVQKLDLELATSLENLLGPTAYRDFQTRVVNRQGASPESGTAPQALRGDVERFLWDHDLNDDKQLDASEYSELARSLAAAPGGFGQLPPPGTSITLFVSRILQFASNGDGLLSPDELPERMMTFAVRGDRDGNGLMDAQEATAQLQKTAYDRVVFAGIYIGGGFANTFVSSRDLLDQLNLEESTLEQAKQLIHSHEQQLQSWTAELIEDGVRAIQKLHESASNAETVTTSAVSE